MPSSGLVTSKARAYMEALSPAARAMLARAARSSEARAGATGNLFAAALAELESEATLPDPILHLDEFQTYVPWRERIEQFALEPLTPFLIDVELPVKQPGRIHTGSVRAIWTWIVRDVAARAHDEALAHDPGPGEADAEPIARRFRREAVALVAEALADADAKSDGRRKLAGLIGGETVLRDLRDVVTVLRREAQIASFLAQAPKSLSGNDPSEIAGCLGLIRSTVEKAEIDAGLVGSALLSRTTAPWLLVTVATRLAGSTDAKMVQASRYGGLVDIALSEADRFVELVRRDLGSPAHRDQVFAWIDAFRDCARHVPAGIDVEGVPAWMKRLSGARKAMSDQIGQVVERAPGLVRRALGIDGFGGEPAGGLDPDAVEDAAFALEAMREARNALDSLALNDVLRRTRGQVEQILDVATARLFADLRSDRAADHRGATAAIDGVIRLSALVHGDEHANVLRKSRDLALQRPVAKAG